MIEGQIMPKNLQIGNDIFEYPVQGDGNWGEEATAWAEAVTEALETVQGHNDILITSANLNNNQIAPANIPGLILNTADVLGVEIDYFIKREYNVTDILVENGKILANFDGSAWQVSPESVGDAGVYITINNSGQAQYTSTNLTGHIQSTIRFKAKTIDEP
jgi:hypothetical protein